MQEIPLESYEQEKLANWLRANNYLFFKAPSETFTKSWKQKRKNRLEWVTKGFPDTTIILKNNALLFIELKRQKRILKNWNLWKSPSVVSEEQKKWIKELNQIKNVQAEVCYWADEAIKFIEYLEDYLSWN